MCGINVIVGPLASIPAIQRMNDALAHRGPDGQGVWLNERGDVALGHRRLAILDLSDRGRQPMSDVSGRVQITFNGEIYNYRELRDRLAAAGHRFHSETDTEAIIALYLEHGLDVVHHLNGMFAFALHDREKDVLLVARDRTGIKPLYYAEPSVGGLAVSSELKALVELEGINRQLDITAIAEYLTYQFIPDPGTPFKGIRRLPPGHMLVQGDGRLDITQWWSGAPPAAGESRVITMDDAATELRATLERAVARQMISDRPVGAFLSGGLDSSAVVAAMARAVGPDQVRCYTVGYDASANSLDPFDEDLPHARRVATHLGVHLQTLEVKADAAALWPMLVRMLDEPIADPATMNAYLIARDARQDGTVVLLTGQGADELFGGYRRHVAGRMLSLFDALPSVARRGLAASASLIPGGRPGRAGAVMRRARKLLEASGGSADERFLQLCAVIPGDRVKAVLSTDALQALGGQDPLDGGRALMGEVERASYVDRMLYRDMKTYLPAQNLHYTDRSTMAAGVEARVPFLDDEVLDLALSLPPSLKIRGRNQTKAVLREAVRPWLPDSVLQRPKTGFGVPLRGWLRGGLRPMVDDLLSVESVGRRGLLNACEIERQRRAFDRGEADYAYAIFTYLTLELWCRAFVDGSDVGTLGTCVQPAGAAALQPA